MAHVLMLNLSYDVPVKLYSMHLLAMAFYLIAPDARRLANLFLFNRLRHAISMPTDTSLILWNDSSSVLSYELPEPWTLRMEGRINGRKIEARLHRADSLKYRLVTRGFRWVNEEPYNR